MFFIFGISNGEKKLDFVKTMVCSRCGKYGRLELYMTFMYFSLFFIPVFRWGRRYYLKTSCCNTVYGIDPELGRRLHKGEVSDISENDLQSMNSRGSGSKDRCANCGYPAAPEFDYCTKCGSKL